MLTLADKRKEKELKGKEVKKKSKSRRVVDDPSDDRAYYCKCLQVRHPSLHIIYL